MKLPASFRQILSTPSISNEIEFTKINFKVKTKTREKFKKWPIFYIMNKKKNHLERKNIVSVDINNDNIISKNEIIINFI
jgi:hypothetical protein